jgi:hypothetical protein
MSVAEAASIMSHVVIGTLRIRSEHCLKSCPDARLTAKTFSQRMSSCSE